MPVWREIDLGIPALLLAALWNWMIGYNPLASPNQSTRNNALVRYSLPLILYGVLQQVIGDWLMLCSQIVYSSMAVVCMFEQVYPSPLQYPALWDALRTLISFAVLETAWIWGLTRLYLQAWGLVGLGKND